MQRADINQDVDGWYHIVFGELANDDLQILDDLIRWCRLHVSNGRFDHGVRWGKIFFYFEQLEDAMMFHLTWTWNRVEM
jgi:hypothetical protein